MFPEQSYSPSPVQVQQQEVQGGGSDLQAKTMHTKGKSMTIKICRSIGIQFSLDISAVKVKRLSNDLMTTYHPEGGTYA